jgi:hypothetical protein
MEFCSGLIADDPGGTIPATACRTAASAPSGVTERIFVMYRATSWSAKMTLSSVTACSRPSIWLPSKPMTREPEPAQAVTAATALYRRLL